MIYAFLVSLAFLIAATVTDVRLTTRGLLKGLAFEGNDIVVHFYGNKPTALQSYTICAVLSLPLISAGLIGVVFSNPGLCIVMDVCMATYAVHHLKGAHEWAKLGA